MSMQSTGSFHPCLNRLQPETHWHWRRVRGVPSPVRTRRWRDAFPLLYLPAYCSFRMTDIWRSFVAQRIAWANDWSVLFHAPNVWQERNEHNLMRDFRDEVPGYLHNKEIGDALAKLEVKAGVERLGENLLLCYEQLVRMDLIEKRELELIAAWNKDLAAVPPSVILGTEFDPD